MDPHTFLDRCRTSALRVCLYLGVWCIAVSFPVELRAESSPHAHDSGTPPDLCWKLARDLSRQVVTDPFQRIVEFWDASVRVTVPARSGFTYSDLTVTCWVRPSGVCRVTEAKIFTHGDVASGNFAIHLGRDNHVFLPPHSGDGRNTARFAGDRARLQPAAWTHLAVVVRDRTAELFLNGSSVGKSAVGMPDAVDSTKPIFIGGLDRSFPGAIDEVRLYDQALDPDEVRLLAIGQPAPSDKDALLGYWPFDQVGDGRTPNLGSVGGYGGVGRAVRVVNGPTEDSGTGLAFDREPGWWQAVVDSLESRWSDCEVARSEAPNEFALAHASAADLTTLAESLLSRNTIRVLFRDSFESGSGNPEVSRGVGLEALVIRPVPATETRGPSTEIDTVRVERPDQVVDLVARAVRLADPENGINPTIAEEFGAVSTQLRRRLWDPLGIEDGERWIEIVPTEELSALPFPSLLREDGTPLGLYHVISYSGGTLDRSGPKGKDAALSGNWLLVGNPAYGGMPGHPSNPYWESSSDHRSAECFLFGRSLFGTLREVRELETLGRNHGASVHVLQWDDAFERTVVREAPGTAVLHIATHSYALKPDCLPGTVTERMALTGLQLSGLGRMRSETSRNEDDGFLSALELSRWPLQDLHLLVLSGCNTLARPNSDLARAAREAGAEWIVGTTTAVDDGSFPDQIANFYEAWLGGADIREAVHESRVRAYNREMTHRGYAAPSRWASLTVQGP